MEEKNRMGTGKVQPAEGDFCADCNLSHMLVFAFNAFSENTILLGDGEGGAVVVDPGMSNAQEWNQFEAALKAEGWTPRAVLLTHAHLDHVMGCAGMAERYGLHPRLHPADRDTYLMAPRAAELYGVPMDPLPPLHEEALRVGESIRFGALELEVRFTPGHAPGHVVFVDHAARAVVGGDVLFRGSVGRTDLPGGDAPRLVDSIQTAVYTLPDDYTVQGGHGSATTIGEEKQSNPFVNAAGTGMMQR